MRLVVDSASGPGGLDATVPGGPNWKVNTSGTTWSYADRAGAHGGITKIKLQDRSRQQDGLLRWSVRGQGGTVVLPAPTAARTAVVLGAPLECAAIAWNGPSGARPRCTGDASRLDCR
jgi:hypothetical protein